MFKHTDKHQLLTLYVQRDSTIHHETIITSCKEMVSTYKRYFVHLFTHGVLYIKGMTVNLNHK